MRWNLKYAIKSYIRGSMWLVPLAALLFYFVFQRITYGIGDWLVRTGRIDPETSLFGLSIQGARSMLETAITLNLSFLVFTFGSLLVAIQVAGGQYTPRIIATTLLRDNVIRFTVGFFVFTMLFALRVLSRMDEKVHQFNTFIAVLLGIISVMVFLYLIDYAARFLRPVSIVAEVGKSGVAVIESVYPERTRRPSPNEPTRSLGSADRIVVNVGAPGVVLAVDLDGLVKLARDANGIIEFVPQVGDFLAVDEPLYRLYGGAGAIDDHRLREAVVLGTERTMEQDPTFAFRILVDIAIKALSAAINDPTTAVLALDQLHRLLRVVGLRNLRGEGVRDQAGELRLVFRTPNWEDFVHLACTEIRHCGAGSIQVVRRVRSMLEVLIQSLPRHRRAELRQQLELLDRAIDGHYAFPEDRALARIPDAQGWAGRWASSRWASRRPSKAKGRSDANDSSVAAALGRAPFTISREIRRNDGPQGYRASQADQAAWDRSCRPQVCKLMRNRELAQLVASKLRLEWSPEQVAGWLKRSNPDDEALQVSHETIYRSLFIQARDALQKELMAHLRRTRGMRRSRHHTQKTSIHGQITGAVSISDRPAVVEDRALPGHWKGDLLFGSKSSQIATLVERQSRYGMLAKVGKKDTETVVNALIKHAHKLPHELTLLETERGHVMARLVREQVGGEPIR